MVVIQVGALGRNRPGRYRGASESDPVGLPSIAPKKCVNRFVVPNFTTFATFASIYYVIMTYYDCGIEAETVTFGHTGEEDVGNWVLLAQASQESVRFSEALGFVRNKIEQDPTQPLAMVITKSLLHLLVKGVEDPFCGQWW